MTEHADAIVCLSLGHDGSVIGGLTLQQVNALRDNRGDGWIIDLIHNGGCYMLFNPYTNLVKIGRSTDIHKRWKNLETQGGTLLHPLAFWHTTAHESVEYALHEQFANSRAIGEWFDAEPVHAWLSGKAQRGAATDAITESPLVSSAKQSLSKLTIRLEDFAALLGVPPSEVKKRMERKLPPFDIAYLPVAGWRIPTARALKVVALNDEERLIPSLPPSPPRIASATAKSVARGGVDVAANIRRERTAKKMTTRRLAEALVAQGIRMSGSGITDIEMGRRAVTVRTLSAIAHVLDVPLEALIAQRESAA